MPAGKRVVVDTNAIVSGILLPRSVPGRLLGFLAEHASIISGDDDLISLGTFESMPILTAARYLAGNIH